MGHVKEHQITEGKSYSLLIRSFLFSLRQRKCQRKSQLVLIYLCHLPLSRSISYAQNLYSQQQYWLEFGNSTLVTVTISTDEQSWSKSLQVQGPVIPCQKRNEILYYPFVRLIFLARFLVKAVTLSLGIRNFGVFSEVTSQSAHSLFIPIHYI